MPRPNCVTDIAVMQGIMDKTALDYPRLMYVEHGANFELETNTLRNSKCTASLCSIDYIRSNKEDQITNTL